MRLWQASMPRGMFLKSQGFASNLSSPDAEHTLEAFCWATGRPFASYGLPVPLETFVAYGQWFRQELVPGLEETLVTEVMRNDGRYEINLANGDRAFATNVVVATGVEHFDFIPEQLSGLPSSVCTHSSAHADLGAFRDKSVVVIGAGQSALESAALLHENGAQVKLVARTSKLVWNGPPLPLQRPLVRRLREPEAGLGSGWSTWFYSRHPELFRHLPQSTRVYRSRNALGPAGACWLPDRVEGKFPLLLGQALAWAKAEGSGVTLGLAGEDGAVRELAADHVIAATGYRPDLRRLTFLADELQQQLHTLAGTAAVDGAYESSVPGLYFVGPVVAPSFGPVMRFVYGSEHAARTVSRRLTASATGRSRVAAGVSG
jgi:FAD-dependent urate hydroxylase